jgi:hypothetical protein
VDQSQAVAQRALSTALDDLLRDAGTTFDRWAALNMLATGGPVPRAALRDQLAAALRAGQEPVSELLDQLESSGLIRVAGDSGARGGARVELTVDASMGVSARRSDA